MNTKKGTFSIPTLLVGIFFFLITLGTAQAVIETVDGSTQGRFVAGNLVSDFIVDGLDSAIVVEPSTGDAYIAFSDLISAPKTGWSAAEPNQGAVVTIWGRNFGSTRGSSYVTVNGVNLTASADYKDTWAEVDSPTPFLQSITFQLNSTMTNGDGTISVTVGGTTSNTVPFRINTIGRIRFVDDTGTGNGTLATPWNVTQIESLWYQADAAAGDVLYFREGAYNDKYMGGSSVIFNDSADNINGTSQDPIALVGYPNEAALFTLQTPTYDSNKKKAIQVDGDYWTVAKVFTESNQRSIASGGDGFRVVGNDVVGDKHKAGGAGIIHAGGSGLRIFGNATHGARSAEDLDHAIYIDGCQVTDIAEVAWNYSYDNFFDGGTHLSDNHQGTRCGTGEIQLGNKFHNNVIDGSDRHWPSTVTLYYANNLTRQTIISDHESRGIQTYEQGWTTGEVIPDPVLVYNNIFFELGNGQDGVMHTGGTSTKFYNNIAWGSSGPCLRIGEGQSGNDLKRVEFVNNICHFPDSYDPGVVGAVFQNPNSFPDSDKYLRNNAYISCAGCESTPPLTNGTVGNAGEQLDPTAVIIAEGSLGFTIDVTAYNPVTLTEGSPVINAGTSEVNAVVTKDFYGNSITTYNIGAVQ